MTTAALAQGNPYPDAKPMFVTLQPHAQGVVHHPASNVVQWNGSFTDLTHQHITFTMLGTDPTKTTTSTTIQVYVVPIKMVYGRTNGHMTFDPNKDKGSTGSNLTVTADVVASPLFNPGVNFTEGGTNLGTTQYIDAYQRGDFWKSINAKGGGYHILYNPTVLSEQKIVVTPAQGGVISNPFGTNKVGTMDINSFDALLQTFITKLAQINPGNIPLFLTDNIFLTSGGCCIGGYHNANGSQPGGQVYGYSTYVTDTGSFSQDTGALSHEIGEFTMDPFIDNHVNCQDNSIMENGDPLERNANYGDFPYVLNGATYELQSLVFIGYFGDNPAVSVHKWLSFRNDMSHVCPGQ